MPIANKCIKLHLFITCSLLHEKLKTIPNEIQTEFTIISYFIIN